MIKRLIKKFRVKVPVYIPVLQSDLLKGRVALITGGTRGIGYSIAKQFLMSGASIIITGRHADTLHEVRERLISLAECDEYRVNIEVLDFSNPSGYEGTLKNICENYKIDILVNNAGVPSQNIFWNVEGKEYDMVMNVNLKAAYFASQIVAKHMIDNDIHGNILFISSSSSNRPATLPYTLSKWGVKGLTEGLAKMLIKYDIVVNSIAPGQTVSGMLPRDANDMNNKRAPIKRMIDPIEIANMATILVSDIGRSVVGDTVYLSGGSGLITFDDIDY